MPKAHTPFQWQGVRPEAEKRLKLLAKRLKPKGIELRPESYGWSVIQALLSRSDRRLAPVIAAVRGRHDSQGGWKAGLPQRLRAEGGKPAATTVLGGGDSCHLGRGRVLPWEHLEGPLPKATLLKHQPGGPGGRRAQPRWRGCGASE